VISLRSVGIVEIAIAVMIGSARVRADRGRGERDGGGMFLTTLSFLFSTPGWEPTLGGFLVCQHAGQFLLKDSCCLAPPFGRWARR